MIRGNSGSPTTEKKRVLGTKQSRNKTEGGGDRAWGSEEKGVSQDWARGLVSAPAQEEKIKRRQEDLQRGSGLKKSKKGARKGKGKKRKREKNITTTRKDELGGGQEGGNNVAQKGGLAKHKERGRERGGKRQNSRRQ